MTSPSGQSQELPVLPTASDLLKLVIRPAQVIEHPSWNEARDRVISLVTGSPSLIAVLGSPGTGKTTLLRDLGSELGERGYAVRLLEIADSPLGVDPAEVVLVDEADRMSSTQLEALCRGGDATIVLAALPAFAKHLQDHYPDAAIVPLAALSPDDAFAFLAERLAQLGLPMTCLTETAWAQLIKHGNGVPRLLFALLKLTLLIAAEKHAARATGVHVKLAVEVRDGIAEGTDVEACDDIAEETDVEVRDDIAEETDVEVRDGIAEGTDVESTPTNPDFAEPDAAGRIPGPNMSADAIADAGKRPRRPWRGTAAGAACLVAAAALLIWWQTNDTASSGPNASPVSVEVKRAEIADAKPDKVGELSRSDGTASSPVVGAATTVQNAAAAGVVASTALQPSTSAGTNESKATAQAPVAPVQSSMAITGTADQPLASAPTMSSDATPAGTNESKATAQAPVAPVQSSMASTGTVDQPLASAATTSSDATPAGTNESKATAQVPVAPVQSSMAITGTADQPLASAPTMSSDATPAGTNESKAAAQAPVAPVQSSMAITGTADRPLTSAATTSSATTPAGINESKAAAQAPVAPVQSSMAITGTADQPLASAPTLSSATTPAGINESKAAAQAPVQSSMAITGTVGQPLASAPTLSSDATPAGINENKAAAHAPVAPVQSSMAITGTADQPLASAPTTSSDATPSDAKVSHQRPSAAVGTTQALPAEALVRVVLTYPRGDLAAAQLGAELARVLRMGGLGVGGPFPVAPRTAKNGISYYFIQDAGAATDILQRLHGEYGDAKLVRLPRAAGQPPPGTIEITLGSD